MNAPSRAPAPKLKSGRPGRPLVVGIVNATPDSFFACSRVPALEQALAMAKKMEAEGADWIDVGGESTRPGAPEVSETAELKRVLPIVERLAETAQLPISIDTMKPGVALRARRAGARILNDVFGLRAPGMLEAALEFEAVVVMHMQGDPRTMQAAPRYGDIVGDILSFFNERAAAFVSAGGDREKLWLDPGIGFGKTRAHNEEIFARLEEFHGAGAPLFIGASRKSFIGRILGSDDAPAPEAERLEGSLAAACRAAEAGAAALRVHDVGATRRALAVAARLRKRS